MVKQLYADESIVNAEYIQQVADRMDIEIDEVNPSDDSILASIAQPVSVIFKPQGFGSWKPTVATVTGLIAKENVVGTFGVLYNYDDHDGEDELAENGDQIWGNVAQDFNRFSKGHGKLAAFAFMLFNLLCAPCFAAMGAIKREMNSPKWTLFAIGYMCVFAYIISLIVYQIGMAVSGAVNVIGLIAAIALLAVILWQLFTPVKKSA